MFDLRIEYGCMLKNNFCKTLFWIVICWVLNCVELQKLDEWMDGSLYTPPHHLSVDVFGNLFASFRRGRNVIVNKIIPCHTNRGIIRWRIDDAYTVLNTVFSRNILFFYLDFYREARRFAHVSPPLPFRTMEGILKITQMMQKKMLSAADSLSRPVSWFAISHPAHLASLQK